MTHNGLYWIDFHWNPIPIPTLFSKISGGEWRVARWIRKRWDENEWKAKKNNQRGGWAAFFWSHPSMVGGRLTLHSRATWKAEGGWNLEASIPAERVWSSPLLQSVEAKKETYLGNKARGTKPQTHTPWVWADFPTSMTICMRILPGK